MRRRILFVSALLAGLVLALAGFFLAAPIGPPSGPDYSNPRILFAPGVFIIGVILVFGSAIVYEVVREK